MQISSSPGCKWVRPYATFDRFGLFIRIRRGTSLTAYPIFIKGHDANRGGHGPAVTPTMVQHLTTAQQRIADGIIMIIYGIITKIVHDRFEFVAAHYCAQSLRQANIFVLSISVITDISER